MTATSVNAFSSLWLDALWKASWQGGIAVTLVMVVCWAVPKIPARMQCWLWRLALLKLLITGLWIAPLELPWLPSDEPLLVSAEPALAGTDTSHIAASSSQLPIVQSASSVDVVDHLTVQSWLLIVWGMGVTICLANLFTHWCQVQRMRSRFAKVIDNRVFMHVNEICSQMSVRRPPEIRISRDSVSPFLVGSLQPVIVLPSSLVESCSTEQLNAALIHEVAHVKRRDLFWNWLPVLAGAVFFFHPLVWLAKREWCLAQEIATDEVAMSVSRLTVAQYADSLVQLAAKYTVVDYPNLTVAVTETYSQLHRRIVAMKTFSELTTRYRLTLTATVLAIGVLGVVPWKLTAQQTESPSQSAESSTKDAELTLFSQDSGEKKTRTGSVAKAQTPKSPELKVLDRLVGSWRIEVDETMGLPSGIRNGATVVTKWILQGRYIELRVINSDGKQVVQELMTYDSDAGVYNIWVFDQNLPKPGLVTLRWNESKKTFKGTAGNEDVGNGITVHWDMAFIDNDQIDVTGTIKDATGNVLQDEIKAKMIRKK